MLSPRIRLVSDFRFTTGGEAEEVEGPRGVVGEVLVRRTTLPPHFPMMVPVEALTEVRTAPVDLGQGREETNLSRPQ